MRIVLLLSCLVLAVSTSTMASAPAPPAEENLAASSTFEADINIEQLGLDIYRADRTAWLTTDLLVESGSMDRISGKPAGWVTTALDPQRLRWRIAYLMETDQGPASFADGEVDFSKKKPKTSLRENTQARPLDALELAQYQARQNAIARDWLRCARKYNHVALPAPGDGWFVYLLPAQESPDVYPMGGFHRFHYRDNALVLHYGQTRGCLDQSKDDVPEGATLATLMVSHITSDAPTEMHVFMNLAYDLPVAIVTRDGKLWMIENGRVQELKRPDRQP